MPFAVEEMTTEPSKRERDHDHDAARELEAGRDDPVGPPVPGQPGDQHRREVDGEHVRDADAGRAEEAREQERRAADGPDDERLQEAALRVAGDDADRQEHREHDAEEERREEREPEHERAREGARVDVHVGGRRDLVELREDVVVREPEEKEERERQQDDDGEDLAPHRLAKAVLDDDRDRAQSVSPPTASRYVSSSVEVSTRTP